MTMNFKLVVRSGDDINKIYLLEKEKNTIGRDPSCDFVIDDIEISRHHLEITFQGDSVQINDLNSTNGTFLNGKRIGKPTQATNGDLISLGKNIVLEFTSENDKENNSVPQNTEMEQSVEPNSADDQPDIREPLENDILEEVDGLENDYPKGKSQSKLGKKLQSMPTWMLILIIALGFLIIFCVIPLLVIEVTNQWCNLFAGFFNSMSPGVCP